MTLQTPKWVISGPSPSGRSGNPFSGCRTEEKGVLAWDKGECFLGGVFDPISSVFPLYWGTHMTPFSGSETGRKREKVSFRGGFRGA